MADSMNIQDPAMKASVGDGVSHDRMNAEARVDTMSTYNLINIEGESWRGG
jgi:hypothetical protein